MKTEIPLITEVSTDEFPTVVIGASLPVLVDFWAPWCGPCRQTAPLLEELAQEYAGQLTIVKVNVDAEPALASSFGIQSIPSLIFYKSGMPREMLCGLRSASELRTFIQKHLAA